MTSQINRRKLAQLGFGSAASLALWACATGSQGAVTLETAKVWMADMAGAVVAGAGVYTGPNEAQVKDIAAKIQQGAAAFASLGDVATAKTAALSILAMIQQISPIVAPLLGPAGVFVPMAVAVLQAFVAALPVPPDTPPTPPAALHRAATARR